ncbi:MULTISPECIES: TetR/AcrR family transcriptional regulator [unclassified Pseudofrankia]|uniref:TetR/AcrR family transcriptional regulator n=1 Tax=unclassified Pseudofrankia TaxID=2994372 RepID=UPI0008DA40DC|nr:MULTISPECIES: TetR/AcrR family transcriptional regulator [unclassified Pseudofrankia]MDT3444084.1 TetR/AcrR family transcriptional regulator [Pseudofrankia sp. BMG5.37]OHV65304.1 TetR family transcriptional regulator [Pseudofrankia sp. BMG5.36]
MTQNADRLLAATPGSPPPEAPGGTSSAAPDTQPQPAGDVAARTAARTLAARTAGYTNEVRRLLDAGLEVIRRNGISSRPRVADIVAEAGLSNDAFYRHFPSKDALVTALIEDGSERLASYAAHQMSKEPTPAGQVRRWVEAVLGQARGEVAASTLAVMWNGSSTRNATPGLHPAAGSMSVLLCAPFTALGSEHPEPDATLAAYAVFGALSDFLWRRTEPSDAEIDQVTAFCLRAAQPPIPQPSQGARP